MRPSVCRGLAVLILVAAAVRSPAFGRPPRKPPVPHAPVVLAKWEETGYGVVAAEARQDALRKINDRLVQWLDEHRPDVTCRPGLADLEAMVRNVTEPEPSKLPDSGKKDAVEELKKNVLQVQVTAELTDNDLRTLEERTRLVVAEHRQGLMARGLAGVVGLLIVGTGYLRLEEKLGRHKRKIGLVAAGVVGLAALALLALS